MRIIEKVKKFIRNDNKWLIIKEYSLIIIQQLNRYKYARFGKRSVIEKPLRLIGAKRIEIGDDVSILKNARIENLSFHNDKEWNGYLKIGDRTSIGQNFHCASGGKLEIGSDVTISGNVFISNIAHDYKKIGVHVLKQDILYNETKIGDGSFIGYGAVIQPGGVLGKQCVVGSNAVVMAGNYPDYSVIVGCPAKIIKQYNSLTRKWERVKR